MNNNGGWYVVKFLEENAIEVIPSNWLLHFEKCVWPNFPSFATSDVQAALKNRIQPEDGWCEYTIKMISKKLYTKFQLASHAAAKAVHDSDFEKEEGLPTKRKRIPVRKYSSSSENSCEENQYNVSPFPVIPMLPDSQVKTASECTTVTLPSDSSAVPLQRASSSMSNSSLQTEPSALTTVSHTPKRANTIEIRQCRKSQSPMVSIVPDSQVKTASECTTVTIPSDSPVNTLEMDSSSLSTQSFQMELSRSTTGFHTPKHTTEILNYNEFQRKVLRYLISIETKQRDQRDTLLLIQDKLERLDKPTSDETSVLEDSEINIMNRFPIHDEMSLQDIEELMENNDCLQKVIVYVSGVGGRNTSEFIRRALSRLVTNEFATGYSWIGHKGKKPFCNLKIASVLKSAVWKYNKNNSWTEKDIELAAAKWLAKAGDRVKASNKGAQE